VTASIALVSCPRLAEGEDARELGTALSALGMHSSWQVLNDPAVDWPAADLAILRSTWDYLRDAAATVDDPDPDELRLGGRVKAVPRRRLDGELPCARVDAIPTPYGRVVLELELIEPSLFFQYDQDAAARFAATVSRRL
jgi:hypothetical protein